MLSEDFGDDGRYSEVKNPVATTWLVSFDQIRRHDPLAAEYLSMMACFNPRGIPEDFLPAGPTRNKRTVAIGTLSAYSFIYKQMGTATIDLHRLVHLTIRSWLRKEELLDK